MIFNRIPSAIPPGWMPEKQIWATLGGPMLQNTWKDQSVFEITWPSRPTLHDWYCSICDRLIAQIDPWAESSSEAQAEFKLDNYRRSIFYPGGVVERHHLKYKCKPH